ncbi:MAG: hypothetical protein KCHDKBKB_00244 [Elusimicrobia bacterium]|nr:hypothetical protein [Elusimicrobiota bacterium]
MFQNVLVMRHFFQSVFFILLIGPLQASETSSQIKTLPTRPSIDAHVIVEDQEILEPCEVEKICVQGQLYNAGKKTAYKTKLNIEIGATKQGKPRHVWVEKLDVPTMAPGDRQEFSFMLNRKIPIKDKQGMEKTIEVGKYNFKVVPVWSNIPPPTKAPRKRKK